MARTPKIVEDRREQIIDAAMRVFAQKGFARATNKDIAREAGITAGLIYHYFVSKEDLLTAVVEGRSPLRLLSNLPPRMFELPPEQFFRILFLQALSIMEDEKFSDVLRVVLSEVLHSESSYFEQFVPTFFQRILGFLSSYIEAKIATGELRPVEDASRAAQVLFGGVVGFELRRVILRDPMALQYSHEEMVNSVLDTFLKGLLPR